MKRLGAILLATLLGTCGFIQPAFADSYYSTTLNVSSTSNYVCSRYTPDKATRIVVQSLPASSALTITSSTAGETPTAVPGIVGPNGQQAPIITASGTYSLNSSGYLRVCAAVSTTGSGSATIAFVSTPNGGLTSASEVTNVSQIAYQGCNKTVSVAISTATTTRIITGVAGKHAFVCAYSFTVSGTSPTLQFEGGTLTSTACDTGAVVSDGPFALPNSTAPFNSPGDGGFPLFDNTGVSASGPDECIVSGGTSPIINGFVRYGIN
jgi:hypothetical protein